MDYSSFGLRDKVAIVTGGSQGIAAPSLLAWLRPGSRGAGEIPDKRQGEVKAVKAEIEALGRKAMIVQTDVAQVDQVRALMDQTHSTFGRIDILVNNAGWTGTTPALDVSEEEYDRTMAASLKSVFFAAQAAARVMIPQGGAESSTLDPILERLLQGAIGLRQQRRRVFTICRVPCRLSGPRMGCW